MRPPTVSQPFLFFCQTADEDYGDGGPRDGYERAEADRAQDAADMAEAEEAAKAAKMKKATDFVSYVIAQALKAKNLTLRGAVGDPLRQPNNDLHKTREEIDENDRRASVCARAARGWACEKRSTTTVRLCKRVARGWACCCRLCRRSARRTLKKLGGRAARSANVSFFYGVAIPHGARARATNPNEETEPVANCLNGDGMEALAAMVKSLHALLAPDRNQRAVKSAYAVLEHA